MTGHLLLDWAILAVSLFNTILLIWLGLAVLLNAERRAWGIWLAGGGLLMGFLTLGLGSRRRRHRGSPRSLPRSRRAGEAGVGSR